MVVKRHCDADLREYAHTYPDCHPDRHTAYTYAFHTNHTIPHLVSDAAGASVFAAGFDVSVSRFGQESWKIAGLSLTGAGSIISLGLGQLELYGLSTAVGDDS